MAGGTKRTNFETKRRSVCALLPAAVTAAAVVFLLSFVPQAQAAHADFSSDWVKRKGPAANETTPPPLTPEGSKIYERNKVGIAISNPEIDTSLRCLPTGFPRSALGTFPFYILETPKAVGIVAEAGGGLPQMIYLNAKHQALWPTFMGDSVGHWDGETLVVDVVNMTTDTFFNSSGLPHSKALHIVERYTLIDGGKTLQNEMTIEDPKIFTKPWVITLLYDRADDLRPMEVVCTNPRLKP